MANQVSLLEYLQLAYHDLPVAYVGQSIHNTTNSAYNSHDITDIGHWANFNLATIIQEHGALLAAAQINFEPVPQTPPNPITSEALLRTRIDVWMHQRIARALRCGFVQLQANNNLTGRTVVNYDGGTAAMTIGKFIPDVAYFDPTLPSSTRPNRLPGDIKPSYKWSMALGNQQGPRPHREFRQALSQLNYYMGQHHARHGFLLTDRELVAVKRLDQPGHVQLSDPIPWGATGTAAQPRLTILLALWYLGMLASDDQQWSLP